MSQAKQFKTYTEQVELLRTRGMLVTDQDNAEALLARLNYYRLSGYWYPMRQFSGNKAQDRFAEGASFDLVIALYEFDECLRHTVFAELDRVEMAIRTLLGHELGRIDPLIHLHPEKLSASAKQSLKSNDTRYNMWLKKYKAAMKNSKEDFVTHHKNKYSGLLPIWAAVEVMDWGMLSHLYAMSPNIARESIAERCELQAPQLGSWLKSLNVLRNLAAHHARMFNRVYGIKPKLSNDPNLIELAEQMNRSFGQLSLIQYLHRKLELSPANQLPRLFDTYPHNPIVPLSRTGAPEDWQHLPLWELR